MQRIHSFVCVCVRACAPACTYACVWGIYVCMVYIWDICARVWLYNDTQRINSNITAHLVFLRESHGTWSSLLHLVPSAGLAEPRLQWASCARVIGAWRMSTAIFKKSKTKTWCWDLNSYPHICAASTYNCWATSPSPDFGFVFFWGGRGSHHLMYARWALNLQHRDELVFMIFLPLLLFVLGLQGCITTPNFIHNFLKIKR